MIYTIICVAIVSACFGVIFGEDFKRKVCRHRGKEITVMAHLMGKSLRRRMAAQDIIAKGGKR